ncbi:MAG: hypothetical protein JO107_08005 [Hyphomicrobiales bacterium]|nr:hypothetical protein [Hyphomicrobiales bacterium]MBV8663031.1 hypothetical protein [Hyphomicrobiales bacterium]
MDPTPASPPTMDVGEFLRIARKQARLLLPCMAIAGALCLGYIVTAPTRYAATMSIFIDPRERVPLGIDAAPMPQSPDVALIESEMRILTSKPVLRKLVERQHLLDDPDYRPGGLRQILAALLPGGSNPDARMAALVESLGKDIAVKRSERNYIIDVETRAGSPERAAQLASGLADAYFASQKELSEATAAQQSAWLDSKLNDLRGRVEAAERRAQDYRDAQSLVMSDGHVSPEQQLKDANDALVAARGRRAEVASRYEQIKAAIASGASPESIDAALNSPVIAKLRADQSALARDEAYERSVLGPRHPSYLTTRMQLSATQDQISAETKRIEAATERELKAAERAEKDAAGLVATLEGSTQTYADRRVELGQLESEAATLRADYEKLLTTRLNVRRDVLDTPLSTLIDPPVASPARISPRTSLALFLALVGGLNLWMVAALVAEYRERGKGAPPAPEPVVVAPVVSPPADAPGAAPAAPPDSLWFAMDAPHFPADDESEVGVAEIEAAMRSDPNYRDAIQALLERIADRFDTARSAPVIALAARTRRAGASTIALSLARAAAAAGDRVLVVDCDYRRPTLSEMARRMRKVIIDAAGQVGGVICRDDDSGGEALALAFDERGRRSLSARLHAKFDLVLLDCGPLTTAVDWLGDESTADALIVVDSNEAEDARLAAMIERIGAPELLVGVVRRQPARARISA